MSIKERWQRLVSRKSLSSGHSSSSSSSSSDRHDPCDTPPSYNSSGASTPLTLPTPTAAAPPAPLAITIPHASSSSSSNNNQKPSAAQSSSSFQSNFLSKTLTWRSSHGNGEKKKRSSARGSDKPKDAAAARRRIHPSERPLTEANLRQQEMLSQFKWEFGRSTGRRNSLGGWSVNSGISPCQSRRESYAVPPDAL